MKAKITKNGPSVQVIIPKSVADKYGFRSGLEILIEEREEGILLKNESMMTVDAKVWSIGYEGWVIDKFVEKLKSKGIEQLLDVRELAISRKKGFSKSSLKNILESNGIQYVHIPELGSPKNIRGEYKETGDRETFMEAYQKYLNVRSTDYDTLKGLVMVKPSVLMCFENDVTYCHRGIIANKLKSEGFNLSYL